MSDRDADPPPGGWINRQGRLRWAVEPIGTVSSMVDDGPSLAEMQLEFDPEAGLDPIDRLVRRQDRGTN